MGYYIKQHTPSEQQYDQMVDKLDCLLNDTNQPEDSCTIILDMFKQLMTGLDQNIPGSEFDWGVENDDGV